MAIPKIVVLSFSKVLHLRTASQTKASSIAFSNLCLAEALCAELCPTQPGCQSHHAIASGCLPPKVMLVIGPKSHGAAC